MSHMQPPLQAGTAGIAAGPESDAGFAADEPPAPDVPPDDRRLAPTAHTEPAASQSALADFGLDLQAAAAAILASRAVMPDEVPMERAYSSTGSAGTERTADGTDDAAAAAPAPAAGEGALRIEKLHQQERHMWNAEETQALVDGCNKVSRCFSCSSRLPCTVTLTRAAHTARHRQLESHPLRPRAQGALLRPHSRRPQGPLPHILSRCIP